VASLDADVEEVRTDTVAVHAALELRRAHERQVPLRSQEQEVACRGTGGAVRRR
jgi:hypothetical protein